MKLKLALILAFVSVVSLHCSKDNNSNPLTGNWTFRSGLSVVGPYPSMFTNGAPASISSVTYSFDHVLVSFQADGNFTFRYFDKVPQTGKYKILQDSLLLIQPDTSDFLQFCSFQFQLSASPTVPPPGIPDLNLEPFNDTVLMRKNGNNEIVFALSNLSKATAPIFPAMDTLLYTEVLSTFRRK